MNGGRFRLVTVQDGREFVSSAGLSEEEAKDFLVMDVLLHRAAGWRVTDDQGVVVACRGNVVRLVSARRFASSNDHVSESAQSRRVA